MRKMKMPMMDRMKGKIGGMSGGMMELQPGDKVRILNPHEEGHTTATIASMAGEPAFSVLIDGMGDEPHKWYVASELEKVP